VLCTVLIGAGVIGLFAWSPWKEPTETEWVTKYKAWSDRTEAALQQGFRPTRASCESTFDDQVGGAPTERLQLVATAARGGCASPSPAGWQRAKADVVRALVVGHSSPVPPRRRRDVSEVVRSSVGVDPDVYCWQPEAWAALSEPYAILRGGEEPSLDGIADRARNRIDLGPTVCAELNRYLQRIRPTALSNENLELADTLVLLTHMAEHLKRPSASEAEIECYAMQHVRPLVRAAGWGNGFAGEIASHAWELTYPQLPPRFRTPRCREGGELDLSPGSHAWP
jgi:hypothetical protein